MFGLSLRERVTKEVTNGLAPLVRVYEITAGQVPKGFWEDHYVLGYIGTTALLLAKITSRFRISGGDLGFVMFDTLSALSRGDGQALAKKYLSLSAQPTPAFQAGVDAAEKVVAVGYGKTDFDADPEVIKARESVRKLGNAFGDAHVSEHGRTAGQLMNTLFHAVVRDRLGE